MTVNTKLQVITWRAEEECLWLYALLTDDEIHKKNLKIKNIQSYLIFKNIEYKNNFSHPLPGCGKSMA